MNTEQKHAPPTIYTCRDQSVLCTVRLITYSLAILLIIILHIARGIYIRERCMQILPSLICGVSAAPVIQIVHKNASL